MKSPHTGTNDTNLETSTGAPTSFVTVFDDRTGDAKTLSVTTIPLGEGPIATLKLNVDSCDSHPIVNDRCNEGSLLVTGHYQREPLPSDNTGTSLASDSIRGGLQFALLHPQVTLEEGLNHNSSGLCVYVSQLIPWRTGILDVRLVHVYFGASNLDAAIARSGFAKLIFVDSSSAVHFVRVDISLKKVKNTQGGIFFSLHAQIVEDSSVISKASCRNNEIGLAFDYLLVPETSNSSHHITQHCREVQTVSWTASSGQVYYTADFQNSAAQNSSVPLPEFSPPPLEIAPQSLSNKLRSVEEWHAHDAEVWAIGLETVLSNGRVLATGADDSCLKLWDVRIIHREPSSINSRTHGSGVTVVKFDPLDPYLLYTGSYDGIVRIWDSRNLTKPVQEVDTPDGIWRLEHLDPGTNYIIPRCAKHMRGSSDPTKRIIAVAATRGGCVLLERSTPRKESVSYSSTGTPEFQLTKFGQYSAGHHSMVYGIAGLGIYSQQADARIGLFSSVSFYDNSLCLWTQHLPKTNRLSTGQG